MAKDAELDRLKAVQDLAFQRKQSAYDAQQRAWERRSSARDAMNRAYEAKQRAYAEQESTWQALQHLRDSYGPRIEQLNRLQEAAFQNMGRAFDNASSAYDRRDGASAASYAAEGHRHKAESQGYVSERRGLVAELRAAKDRHESTKPAFQRAKDDFSTCKRTFDAAKAEHERAQTEFQRAKADFDTAAKAFKVRLEKVKAENKKRREDYREIARRAGVPVQHLDNIKVRKNSDGSYDIFYGGAGAPDGLGHGHATLDRFGNAAHDRRPFDVNSPENFAEEQAYIDFQRSKGHRGGYGLAHYGYIDGLPVTYAHGWGSKDGHTLLADGHVDKKTFHRSGNHNHYGPGKGPHDNAMDRGKYTGPGA